MGGRAFFRNAGKTHNDGAEVGLIVIPISGLTLNGAYTYARYRFADYSWPTATVLDGNRLPGVPEHFWRLGLRTSLPAGSSRRRSHDQLFDRGRRRQHDLGGCVGRRGHEPPARLEGQTRRAGARRRSSA